MCIQSMAMPGHYIKSDSSDTLTIKARSLFELDVKKNKVVIGFKHLSRNDNFWFLGVSTQDQLS